MTLVRNFSRSLVASVEVASIVAGEFRDDDNGCGVVSVALAEPESQSKDVPIASVAKVE